MDQQEQTNECPICIESYTSVARARISCTKCSYDCCKVCFKRYISDEEHYLSCMSCHTQFDRTTLYSYLGASYLRTTYRDIRQCQIYEEEKSYFTATQAIIDHECEIEKLKKSRETLDVKYDQIRKERMVPLKEFRFSTEVMEVHQALDRYLQIQANIEIVDEQLQDERQSITSRISDMESDAKPAARTYVLACTQSDCKGMLSNESKNEKGYYVCSICDTNTCSKCQMQVILGNHVCDPDVLETVRYMETTSKPCPSCGVRIHKISGCNQMFCTSCNASFDWRTMRLNNGAVHNPHHAEWLRTNRNRPRELGDIQCGRELSISHALDADEMLRLLIDRSGKSGSEKVIMDSAAATLFNAVRLAVHHHHTTIPALGRNRHGHHTNQRLRIQLLTNIIDERTFMREVQKRDKQSSKRNELLQVVMTYRDAITDIIWAFVSQRRNTKAIEEWMDMIKEVQTLIDYVNSCFERIGSVYGTSVYDITDDRAIR